MNTAFSGEEGTPADLLAGAEGLYRDVAEELILAMHKVRQGEFGEVRAATQAVKDLRVAFQLVMDERTRVEKLRKQVAGVVRDYALDFDAARDEIGRRLARLREAGGG